MSATITLRDASEYVMPFGKHEGKSLEEIYIADAGYLDWCLDNLDDKHIIEKIEMIVD